MYGKERGAVVESRKKWSVWIAISTTILLFILLVFCTVFGEKIYTWITPWVPVQRTKTLMYKTGEEYICIPKNAVTGKNTIYVVTSEQGFSRMIYRIWEFEIEYMDNEYESSEVYVLTEVPQGSFIVTDPGTVKKMKDGDQVLIGKKAK